MTDGRVTDDSLHPFARGTSSTPMKREGRKFSRCLFWTVRFGESPGLIQGWMGSNESLFDSDLLESGTFARLVSKLKKVKITQVAVCDGSCLIQRFDGKSSLTIPGRGVVFRGGEGKEIGSQ
jgi:hypothetical protein